MNDIQLTDTDRRIVHELAADARLPYKDLATRVGIPISTCHGRVRALENAGVIRGYRADIEPSAAGQAVEALIMVSVNGRSRDKLVDLAERMRDVVGVRQVFVIGGERDLVLHVACSSVPELRALISKRLASVSELEQTHTSIVFERLLGNAPV